MDSIFDDDSDEVGSDVEAYCPSPRCKADTNHTVISKYEDEIRRVQCVVCGDVHAYRKPRGETLEEQPESPARKKLLKKPTWEEAMARTNEKDLERCRPYSIRDTYDEGDIVSHPTFHVGFVTELLPDNKLEITFRDERRILVHNRADLAAKMPAIAEMPAPRAEKKKGKKAKKGSLAARWATPLENPPPPLPKGKARAAAQAALAAEASAKEAAAERAAASKLMGDKRKAPGKPLGKPVARPSDKEIKAVSEKARKAEASKQKQLAQKIAKAEKAAATNQRKAEKAAANNQRAAKAAAKTAARSAKARSSKAAAKKPVAKAKPAVKKPAKKVARR